MSAQTLILLACVAVLAFTLFLSWMGEAEPFDVCLGDMVQGEAQDPVTTLAQEVSHLTGAIKEAIQHTDGIRLPVYETKGQGAVPRDLPAHAEKTMSEVREWFEKNGPAPRAKAKPRHRKPTQTPAKRERKG